MGDAFVEAFAAELRRTQRALPVGGLLCVPQPRALLADAPVTRADLFAHFLAPAGFAAGVAHISGRPGEYETLDGRAVVIEGSHVRTGAGFSDARTVRILLSEVREVEKQRVTLLHLSRPLVGGVELPEDPNELDVATFRRLTAILRAFPENELVFYQLDDVIQQVKDICSSESRDEYERVEGELSDILREEWEAAVEELIRAGSFEDLDAGEQLQEPNPSHLLQMQQVAECYLMEQLHDYIFPKIVESFCGQDATLARILFQMRHYSPVDFGIRKEFQCFAPKARDELLRVAQKKTPLDMLLGLKACIDHINDAITENVRVQKLDFERYQLTTDDILDQLLLVLIQAFNHAYNPTPDEPLTVSPFPIVAILQYITDFHFINSNTTALGFTIANFQVAVEFFLMKGVHDEKGCDVCKNSSVEGFQCVHRIRESKCEGANARNQRALTRNIEESTETSEQHEAHPTTESIELPTTKSLLIIGDWSNDDSETNSSDADSTSSYHRVEIGESGKDNIDIEQITELSAGRRFFTAVDGDGKVYSWGDSSGGRLGYSIPIGHSRRIPKPQRVAALSEQLVVHVSCGAFHVLANDINGHVFSWGNNARGQLGFVARGAGQGSVPTPTLVRDLCGVFVSAVASGEYHSLALTSSGSVYSWGCNRCGKLGRETKTFLDATQPQVIESDWMGRDLELQHLDNHHGSGVRRIAAGKDHSIAVACDGSVFTWGRGDSGQLGHGSYINMTEPTQVMALASPRNEELKNNTTAVVQAAAGGDFSLFLTSNPRLVYITGRDPSLPTTSELLLLPEMLAVPRSCQPDAGQLQFASISAGDAHYCLVTTNGTLMVSHFNHETEVASVKFENDPAKTTTAGSTTGEREDRSVRVLGDVGRIVSASAGGSHTLALALRS